MKVLKEGRPKEQWRIVRDRDKSTSCIHGRPLSEAACDKCTSELLNDEEGDRSWRASQAGSEGGYCNHGVPLDEACADCQREKAEQGD